LQFHEEADTFRCAIKLKTGSIQRGGQDDERQSNRYCYRPNTSHDDAERRPQSHGALPSVFGQLPALISAVVIEYARLLRAVPPMMCPRRRTRWRSIRFDGFPWSMKAGSSA